MRSLFTTIATLLAPLLISTYAQQLAGSQMYVDYPGLSDVCADALNTNVSCPLFLGPLSSRGAILDTDEVNGLCTSSCYTSLNSAKSTIEKSCLASTDVIVYDDIAYPATFIIDNYIYTYNLSCRRDSNTDKFCDPQILSWSQKAVLTSTQLCSDCWLGGQALQLNSPLGYDDSLARNHASLTSSCSATNYAFASPTAYAINSTATTMPPMTTSTPLSNSTASYVVQAADDCHSVATTLNVSTFSLLHANNLDLYCRNFPSSAGTRLRVPAKCSTHTWEAMDSCESVVANLTGTTVPQFLAWNPNFNSLCQNSLNFVGFTVCVSPPGGYLNYTAFSSSSDTTISASTAVPAPTNAMVGSNRKCSSWYQVQKNDDCGHISISKSVSLPDFYFLNPDINANCSNLLLDISYCVAAVGAISTYSGYPTTSAIITVPPASFASINTATAANPITSDYIATASLLPQASGTLSGCSKYLNHDDTGSTSDCEDIAYAYDATMNEIVDWNPSLSSNPKTCNLQKGFSYCVARDSGSCELTLPCVSV